MVDNSDTYWRCYLLPIVFCHPLELGFRSKYPLDFLAHTRWVNRYFEDKGFELVKHLQYEFPRIILQKK